MPELFIKKSRAVTLVPYRPQWVEEFELVGRRIRGLVGGAALRIDHIGSTAIPGLDAKDVIDIQVTVVDLADGAAVVGPLHAAGFQLRPGPQFDVFHALPVTDAQLRKQYMREPEGQRRVHIHIREQGRFNQRFALLCRDYLRASSSMRDEYQLLKLRAAEVFPESIDGYLFLKDPVFHMIYEAASLWARYEGWAPDDDHL